MEYFRNVAVRDKIYSLVFGEGETFFVLPERVRVDGSYMFGVKYGTKEVYYTVDGIADWCGLTGACEQTAFYCTDVKVSDHDFSPTDEVMTKRKIEKHIENELLQMRCPSGIWRKVLLCPAKIVEKAISKDNLHLFRKVKFIGKERRSGKRSSL